MPCEAILRGFLAASRSETFGFNLFSVFLFVRVRLRFHPVEKIGARILAARIPQTVPTAASLTHAAVAIAGRMNARAHILTSLSFGKIGMRLSSTRRVEGVSRDRRTQRVHCWRQRDGMNRIFYQVQHLLTVDCLDRCVTF